MSSLTIDVDETRMEEAYAAATGSLERFRKLQPHDPAQRRFPNLERALCRALLNCARAELSVVPDEELIHAYLQEHDELQARINRGGS
ncbi:hypothetical protein OC845_006337 [Tilletia horrida]|nr:hypothetical protein OC845_006337 [Tilletia horrida]